jgi:predicted lactoylglutathione lyase
MFLNLPVADLARSVRFFTGLGFTFDPRFTDEQGTCMLVGADAAVMLLVEPFFRTFTTRGPVDPAAQCEVLVAVSARDRAEVDDLAARALAGGGTPAGEPQDHGFMYQRSFLDPDGHHWEVVWMDESADPAAAG